jgi:hypothetical protein
MFHSNGRHTCHYNQSLASFPLLVQYAVPYSIRVNKLRRLRLAGNVAGMEVIRNTNNILIGKFETNHAED